MNRRLLRRQEPCPDADTAGTKGQRRDETGSVDETTGRDDRNRIDPPHDLRHQHRCRDLAAVATGLATLRDDHIGTELRCLFGLLDRRHLHRHLAAGVMTASNEISGIARGERDHRHGGVKGHGKGFLVQIWRQVVDRKRPIGPLADLLDAVGQCRNRPSPGTDASKPTRIRHRHHQRRRRVNAHASLDDRDVDPQHIAQFRPQT